MEEESGSTRGPSAGGLILAVSAILLAVVLVLMRHRLEAWFSPGAAGSTSGRFDMQTTELLPFEECTARDVPKARTPDGAPLDIKGLEGSYLFAFGPGAAQFKIHAGLWDMTWCGCFPPGSQSRGTVTVEDGRLVFESFDASGKPTGKKCAATPVWWGNTVFVLGRKEIPEFLQNLNWGGTDLLTRGSRSFFVRQGTTSVAGSKGSLVLPPAMEQKVVRAPWSGPLLSKDASGCWKVNFGRRQGAYVGQRVLTKVHSEESGYLDIVSVEDDSCLLKPAEYQKAEGFQEGTEVWADAMGSEALAESK